MSSKQISVSNLDNWRPMFVEKFVKHLSAFFMFIERIVLYVAQSPIYSSFEKHNFMSAIKQKKISSAKYPSLLILTGAEICPSSDANNSLCIYPSSCIIFLPNKMLYTSGRRIKNDKPISTISRLVLFAANKIFSPQTFSTRIKYL